MEKRRVLITGGMGFVGSHLIHACLDRGWEVSTIYPEGQDLSPYRHILGSVRAYAAGGATAEILAIVAETRPELVFHLASLFIAEHQAEDILPLLEANVLFGTQVLEAVGLHRIPYFVNTGSSWQHFHDEPYHPVNLYAATKQAFEDILLFYVRQSNLCAITLKLFDTYGPGDTRKKLLSLLRDVSRHKQPLAMSPGEQRIDLVHVRDVAAALMIAADRLFEGGVKGHEAYAVSSGAPIRIRELVALCERVSGQPIPVSWGERPYRHREVMEPWATGERLPGWTPHVALPDGLRAFFEDEA